MKMPAEPRRATDRLRSPVTRLAAGLALAVLALWLLVQALVALAVREVTDDYVSRFMRGTVELLQHELAPLPPAARAERVRALDERFAYPVALVPLASLPEAERARLAQGEIVVTGLNRRVLAGGPGAEPPAQALVLGPLGPDWNPGPSGPGRSGRAAAAPPARARSAR
jgi:two-component system sensor histidine kinase RstB